MTIPNGIYDVKNSKGQSIWSYSRYYQIQDMYSKQVFFKNEDQTCYSDLEVEKIYIKVVRNTCFPGEVYNIYWDYQSNVDKGQNLPMNNDFSVSIDHHDDKEGNLVLQCFCCDPYFSFINTTQTSDTEYRTNIIAPPINIPAINNQHGRPSFVVPNTRYLTCEETNDYYIKPPCTLPWARISNSNIETFTLSFIGHLNPDQGIEDYFGIEPPLCLEAPIKYWQYFKDLEGKEADCTQNGCTTELTDNCKYKDYCSCLEDNGILDNPYCLSLKKKTQMPWWAWFLVSVAIVGIILAVALPLSLKKKKKRA